MMALESQINRHLDRLFAGVQDTLEHRELKEEIRGNLLARMEDYMAKGMSEEQAYQTAIQHIEGMEQFMSDERCVKRVPYWTALLQSTLVYSLVAWIMTIPTRVKLEGALLNNLLFIVSLIVGIAYVFYMFSNRGSQNREDQSSQSSDQDKTMRIRLPVMKQWQRRVWWLWAAVIFVIWGTQAALRFGSNIWFNRPIEVDGPYQLAVILVAFALPLISIIVPLVVNRAYRIVSKYEVSENI